MMIQHSSTRMATYWLLWHLTSIDLGATLFMVNTFCIIESAFIEPYSLETQWIGGHYSYFFLSLVRTRFSILNVEKGFSYNYGLWKIEKFRRKFWNFEKFKKISRKNRERFSSPTINIRIWGGRVAVIHKSNLLKSISEEFDRRTHKLINWTQLIIIIFN